MTFFLGLITRCKDEYIIEEFCNYYLSQGVDHIYIIDDNSINKKIYDFLLTNKYLSHITIIYKTGLFDNRALNQMKEVNILYNEIKKIYTWIISVDVDEFIVTKKNLKKTIKEELETTFKDVDCIKIPWVMMSSNNLVKTPSSVLQTNVFRWNHNKKHFHPIKKFECRYDKIQVKCIFKTQSFESVDIHHPCNPISKNINIVCGIQKDKKKLNPFYKELREKDIKEGYLLCYHYRIISIEQCIHKLETNNKYKDMKYTLKDLLDSDHSEIYDDTLRMKSLKIIEMYNNTI